MNVCDQKKASILGKVGIFSSLIFFSQVIIYYFDDFFILVVLFFQNLEKWFFSKKEKALWGALKGESYYANELPLEHPTVLNSES